VVVKSREFREQLYESILSQVKSGATTIM